MYVLIICDLIPCLFLDGQIPSWFGGESPGRTKDNPFALPDAYMTSQQRNVCALLQLVQQDYLIYVLLLSLHFLCYK